MRIIILEDHSDRRIAMMQWLAARFPLLRTEFFDSSTAMIETMQAQPLDDVVLISLDHDLEMLPGGPGEWVDPGSGLIAARWLAERDEPLCPVIVATTNVRKGDKMMHALNGAGWNPQRVTPFEDVEWVSSAWFPLVRNAIVSSAPVDAGDSDRCERDMLLAELASKVGVVEPAALASELKIDDAQLRDLLISLVLSSRNAHAK